MLVQDTMAYTAAGTALGLIDVQCWTRDPDVKRGELARFQIEVFHRTLKSGCKIEERQLGNADRIEACLAIDMVVAWRIVRLTKLGREVPEVPLSKRSPTDPPASLRSATPAPTSA